MVKIRSLVRSLFNFLLFFHRCPAGFTLKRLGTRAAFQCATGLENRGSLKDADDATKSIVGDIVKLPNAGLFPSQSEEPTTLDLLANDIEVAGEEERALAWAAAYSTGPLGRFGKAQCNSKYLYHYLLKKNSPHFIGKYEYKFVHSLDKMFKTTFKMQNALGHHQ